MALDKDRVLPRYVIVIQRGLPMSPGYASIPRYAILDTTRGAIVKDCPTQQEAEAECERRNRSG